MAEEGSSGQSEPMKRTGPWPSVCRASSAVESTVVRSDEVTPPGASIIGRSIHEEAEGPRRAVNSRLASSVPGANRITLWRGRGTLSERALLSPVGTEAQGSYLSKGLWRYMWHMNATRHPTPTNSIAAIPSNAPMAAVSVLPNTVRGVIELDPTAPSLLVRSQIDSLLNSTASSFPMHFPSLVLLFPATGSFATKHKTGVRFFIMINVKLRCTRV